VLDHQKIEIAGIFHGAAEDAGIAQRPGGIGDGHSTCLFQEAELGHLFAFQPLGNCRHGIDADIGCVEGTPADEVDDRGIVHDRVGGRLDDDACHAASRCGARGRLQRFAVLAAGFAGKHAHVDKAGNEQLPLASVTSVPCGTLAAVTASPIHLMTPSSIKHAACDIDASGRIEKTGIDDGAAAGGSWS
jgi:hypothetical protein